ncbi:MULTISPECIES: hypothetical protein [unclassified Streptomyces]|uniref:hypothetical protein n=1 Tax=unclassified Streptomyces TaxID=2593676 RepID=UPI0011B0602B|nr:MULTISPECIES: hypothetical protein [unclassified Streptomyces]
MASWAGAAAGEMFGLDDPESLGSGWTGQDAGQGPLTRDFSRCEQPGQPFDGRPALLRRRPPPRTEVSVVVEPSCPDTHRPITLSPSGKLGGDVDRLHVFYRRLGSFETTRRGEFSAGRESMVRVPLAFGAPAERLPGSGSCREKSVS